MNNLIPCFTLFFLFLLSSCGNYVERKGSTPAIDPSSQQKLSADFASVREAIFAPRCVVCHQQYSTYEGVIRELSAIQDAITSNRMPKSGGPLTSDQKNILALWVANGSPEREGESRPPSTPPLLVANWDSISKGIFIPKCLACHNPQGQAKFLDLSSRQAIFDQRNRTFGDGAKLVDFDQPSQSYLLLVIQDEEEPMPPNWSSVSPVTPGEIQILKEWIRLGLP